MSQLKAKDPSSTISTVQEQNRDPNSYGDLPTDSKEADCS